MQKPSHWNLHHIITHRCVHRHSMPAESDFDVRTNTSTPHGVFLLRMRLLGHGTIILYTSNLEWAFMRVSNSPVSPYQTMTSPVSPLAINCPFRDTAKLRTQFTSFHLLQHKTCLQVPQTKHLVLRARDHPSFIGGNCDCLYASFMAFELS